MEVFSDRLIAIIITITIPEFKAPEHGKNLNALIPRAAVFPELHDAFCLGRYLLAQRSPHALPGQFY
ncbi:hypothetical protein ACFJIV_11915 [Mucilaginibacter sp. UC70_90]